jgi:hypothetical protein
MSLYVKNVVMPGEYNNYLIGGNLCNAFAVGEIGAVDDFFMVGTEPSDESSYPIITGNILDSEGNVLFRLVRNTLHINPGQCSKIVGDILGYEIHDSAGKMIFRISTKYEYSERLKRECFVTTIDGNFYDKAKQLVFSATSGSDAERIEAVGKCALGFSGGFGIVQNYSKDEMDIVRIALLSKGSIHQRLTGEYIEKEIDFEGKYIQQARLIKCRITITEGNFFQGSNNEIGNCSINFLEKAGRIYNFVKLIDKGNAK